jgi:hypothetical protein
VHRLERIVRNRLCTATLCILLLSVIGRAEEPPTFFRGLNLNGPPVVIDAQAWEGGDASWAHSNDRAFENQRIPLVPDTDSERAKMLRSSRYGGNRVELSDVPAGEYTVFLYVWEDNNEETYSIALNGQPVVTNYRSGTAGHWERLGPWRTRATADAKLIVTSQGGAANFSGIEVWRGDYDGHGRVMTEEELAFFEKRIRPMLVERCYACHSAESEELHGELLVDSRATLRRGGLTGPGVVPGAPDRSLVIQAVRYDDEAMQMPPEGKLTEEEIEDLVRWVQMGAPDPRATATKHPGKMIDIEAARQFWSLRPLASPTVPPVTPSLADWPRNDIDRFVLQGMELHGLAPAIDAERRALIRRATFDLIGLPPTLGEVQAFLEDGSEGAWARVVDRLLSSPGYGERWGRHWMDIVRYADTAGDNSDFPIPQMHRYRDWIIDAFNRDLPYDEFIRDQLAGDLRGGSTDRERRDRIVATGYLANARRFGSRVDDYPQHLTIEDTIDNLGRSFLGLSLSCARCHDHKFDPITQRDYYALYGIFHSTRYPWPGIELDQKQRDFVPLVEDERRAEVERIMMARVEEQSRLDELVKFAKEHLKKANEEEQEEAKRQLERSEKQAREHRQSPLPFETAYAVQDAQARGDVSVQLQGDPTRLGDRVPRRFLTVMGEQHLAAERDTSGRIELAEWILEEGNPLTARVMVNRIWQHHFGRGIVPTPSDFGKQGKPPTHPELLDFLAVQFREEGWSIKSMHRRILMSRTYQQSTQRSPEAMANDPGNAWLSGFPRQRLDAESIRDALLFLGGNLDASTAGAHPFPSSQNWDFTQHRPFKAVYESNRRSVYLMTQRIQRHPYLAIFDGADPSTSTASRMNTTTPLQALYLLNDPWLHVQSERFTQRILDRTASDEGRLQFAVESLLARLPTSEELVEANRFLDRAKKLLREAGATEDEAMTRAWQSLVRSWMRLNEFVYLD